MVSSLAVMLFAVGCVVTSVYPFYMDKDLVYEPGVLGDWVDATATNVPVEYVRIERLGDKGYVVTVLGTEETNGSYAHLFRLKEHLFLDVCVTNRSLDFVPTHQLSKVVRLDPVLETASLNYDWLAKLVEKNPKAIRHMVLQEKPADKSGGRIILTADTLELQRFILKYLNNTNAWNKPSAAKRRL